MAAPKTSFYYSFLVLPADQRRAIIAVWEFCRAVDDAVDEADAPGAMPPDRGGASTGATNWRAASATATPLTPQGRTLQPFVAEFDLPRQAFDDVIDGVAMDLDHDALRDVRRAARPTATASRRPSG